MKVHVTGESRTALCDWASANGLDPAVVAEPIEIVPGPNGLIIRYEAYEFDADGEPLVMPDGVTVHRTQRECLMVVPLPAALRGSQ